MSPLRCGLGWKPLVPRCARLIRLDGRSLGGLVLVPGVLELMGVGVEGVEPGPARVLASGGLLLISCVVSTVWVVVG